MKVFISWSGDLSQKIATELFEWLPMVVQSVHPYMSSESIEKGARWATSISDELEGTSVGIVVLTQDNKVSPWVHFEAGALAKVVGDSKLAPLLFGLKPSEVGTPLSQFQVTQFDRDDVLRLLQSVNSCAGDDALPDRRLEMMHDALWDKLLAKVEPHLAAAAKTMPKPQAPKISENAVSETLEEILTLTRQHAHFVMNPERILTPEVVRQVLHAAYSGGLDEKTATRVRSNLNRATHLWRALIPYLMTTAVEEDDKGLKFREQVGKFDDLLMTSAALTEGQMLPRPTKRVFSRAVAMMNDVTGNEGNVDSNMDWSVFKRVIDKKTDP